MHYEEQFVAGNAKQLGRRQVPTYTMQPCCVDRASLPGTKPSDLVSPTLVAGLSMQPEGLWPRSKPPQHSCRSGECVTSRRRTTKQQQRLLLVCSLSFLVSSDKEACSEIKNRRDPSPCIYRLIVTPSMGLWWLKSSFLYAGLLHITRNKTRWATHLFARERAPCRSPVVTPVLQVSGH
jgi:hypothetical protein